MNGATRCLQNFGENLRRWLSRVQFILLQMDRLQLTAVYCNLRGGVKTTPQMTRFRDAKVCNNLVTDKIDDHRIQSDYNVHNWTTKSSSEEFYTWCCVCVVKPSDKTHDTSDNVTTKTQSTFHTARMNLNMRE